MRGIHHAGIVVSDIHRAIDFYTGILGLELMAELTPPSSGPHLERVLDLPGARLHAGAMLRAGAKSRRYPDRVPGGGVLPRRRAPGRCRAVLGRAVLGRPVLGRPAGSTR
jgi:catechol 2,3-dioxygenase-like lactoylglutathione lyase family enzyme